MLATALGIFMLFFFALLLGSDIVLDALGGIEILPSKVRVVYNILHENRIQYGIFVLLAGSLLQSVMLCSDAFEIYVNDNLEFSKLELHDLPLVGDLNNILAKYNLII